MPPPLPLFVVARHSAIVTSRATGWTPVHVHASRASALHPMIGRGSSRHLHRLPSRTLRTSRFGMASQEVAIDEFDLGIAEPAPPYTAALQSSKTCQCCMGPHFGEYGALGPRSSRSARTLSMARNEPCAEEGGAIKPTVQLTIADCIIRPREYEVLWFTQRSRLGPRAASTAVAGHPPSEQA